MSDRILVKINGIDRTLDVESIDNLPNGNKVYHLTDGTTVTVPKEQLHEGTSGKTILFD